MTREERAKQFMPFDAMKGLSEALRAREERHSRTEKRELAEESAVRLNEKLNRLKKGQKVEIFHYKRFHDVKSIGWLEEIDPVFKVLCLDGQSIHFEDVYQVRVLDTER